MRKIGLIVAVEEEAMRKKYSEGYDLNDGYGTVLYQTAKSQVYALYSGAGAVAPRRAGTPIDFCGRRNTIPYRPLRSRCGSQLRRSGRLQRRPDGRRALPR